jgi:hypothetical protein
MLLLTLLIAPVFPAPHKALVRAMNVSASQELQLLLVWGLVELRAIAVDQILIPQYSIDFLFHSLKAR